MADPVNPLDPVHPPDTVNPPDPVNSPRQSIQPTEENPARYPPFEVRHVLNYTNKQLKYYVKRDAIPPDQVAVFTTAVEYRRRINDALGRTGDTPDEDTEPDADREPDPTPPASILAPRIESSRIQAGNWSYDADGEPDSDYPAPQPGLKGIKIDSRITQLKVDGGLGNFNLWRGDLRNAFTGDPNRFTTGGSRILLAISNVAESIRSLHSASADQHPLLRTHWRKFMRWIKKNTLHGEADRTMTLDKWNDAKQRPDEAPAHFYNRLVVLAAELGKVVDQDEYFPKLLTGLKTVIIRNNRRGQDVHEMVANAQEIWGTFGHTTSKRKAGEEEPRENRTSARGRGRGGRSGRGGERQAEGRPRQISQEERARRQNDGACFKCGKPGHRSAECRGTFNPNPPSHSGATPKDSDVAKAQPARGRGRGYYRGSKPGGSSNDEDQPAAKLSKNE